jgi:ABC-type xylose transport system substrate-binding protein
MRRLVILLVLVALSGVYLVQCAPRSEFKYDGVEPISWRVGLAFPTSPIEVADRSTVGRWSTIADFIKLDLVAHGFREEDIILKQTDKRTEQVKQIDELVNAKVDELIVVPVELSRDEYIAEFGNPLPEYLNNRYSKDLEKAQAQAESMVAANGSQEPDKVATLYNDLVKGLVKPDPIVAPTVAEQRYYKKLLDDLRARSLTDALNAAKAKGVYQIGFGSDDLEGYPFDYFIATPSPEDVANVQAGFAVAHLGLPELDAQGQIEPNPTPETIQNVEVAVSDAVRPTSKRYFTQLWARIGEYFRKGYLQSKSGLLNAESTGDDYLAVAVTEDGDKAAGVMHNILDKYYSQDTPDSKLGMIFNQSDALSRGAVRACVEASWSQFSNRWPLITGFGAEKITISDVIENKQSMSIGFDSKALAYGASQVLYNRAVGADQLTRDNYAGIQNQELLQALDEEKGTVYLVTSQNSEAGAQMNLLVGRPVTITSDNLKEFLIDGGYTSAAEAGL